MRTITRATLALTGAAALTLFAVVPANAVDSTVTVQVVGVPATIATGAVSASGEILPNAAASVTISDVFVNDGRAVVGDWSVTASASAFVGLAGADAAAFADTAIGYTPGGLETSAGSAAALATTVADLSTADANAESVATNAAVQGVNSATWDAVLEIPVPVDAIAGSYSTTITHTLIAE
jgi:hypothetical protein